MGTIDNELRYSRFWENPQTIEDHENTYLQQANHDIAWKFFNWCITGIMALLKANDKRKQIFFKITNIK